MSRTRVVLKHDLHPHFTASPQMFARKKHCIAPAQQDRKTNQFHREAKNSVIYVEGAQDMPLRPINLI